VPLFTDHKDSCESELKLFERLARALLHSIRGDLAVIQNDLSYFASTGTSEDVARAKARCGSISATLAKLSHARAPQGCSAIAVRDLIEPLVIEGPDSEAELFCDRTSLKRALSFIPSVLAVSIAEALVEVHEKELLLVLNIFHKSSGADDLKYPSLSAYAAQELGEGAVIEAAVADLILRDHGCRTSICVGSQAISIQLLFANYQQRVEEIRNEQGLGTEVSS